MASVRYENGGDPFVVMQFSAETSRSYSEKMLAFAGKAANRILTDAWTAKLVPDTLTDADVATKIPSATEMAKRLKCPEKDAVYMLAIGPTLQETDEPDLRIINTKRGIASRYAYPRPQTLMKVERYKPRNPLARDYPNITDLETGNGAIDAGFRNQTAAVVFHGLNAIHKTLGNGRRKVAAHEVQDSDGVAFYESVGFHQTGNRPTEQVGQGQVTYVHLEAPSLDDVLDIGQQQYPWLMAK